MDGILGNIFTHVGMSLNTQAYGGVKSVPGVEEQV
jgi:hypothetical protein